MTNFEKYKTEILSVKGKLAMKNGQLVDCNKIHCEDCEWAGPIDAVEKCSNKMFEWLYSDYEEMSILDFIQIAIDKYETCNKDGCSDCPVSSITDSTIVSCGTQVKRYLERKLHNDKF